MLVNQAFANFYGITVEQAIGLTGITEGKLAQEALRLSEARFRVAIDLWANQIEGTLELNHSSSTTVKITFSET